MNFQEHQYQEQNKQDSDAAFREAKQKQTQPFRTVGAECGNGPKRPNAPTVRDIAAETFSALEDAHAGLDRIFESFAGASESPAVKERDRPGCLKDMLAYSSELASMLVGRLATLNAAI